MADRMAVIAATIAPRHTDRVAKVLIATEGRIFLFPNVKISIVPNYI
jgi:hypothetical protein